MDRPKRKQGSQKNNSNSNKRTFHSFKDQKFTQKSGLFAPTKLPRDPFTNQDIAFPGLGNGDEEFAGPACDGLSYLKLVRSEARTVPAVLVPTPEIKITMGDEAGLPYDDSEDPAVVNDLDIVEGEELEEEYIESTDGDWGYGFDQDDAIIAPPSPTPPPSEISALAQWHTSTLLPVFYRARSAYVSSPSNLPSPYTTPIGVADWHTLVRDKTKSPSIAFLKSLDHDNILRGLRYNADLLKAGRDCDLEYTRWIWALLVAIKPWDELDEEGLVVIRNVGKKAAQVLSRLAAAGELAEKKEGEEVEEVRQRPGRKSKNDKYAPYTPSANTLATLDMVVGVVGECWRQRDLLIDRVTHSLGAKWEVELETTLAGAYNTSPNKQTAAMTIKDAQTSIPTSIKEEHQPSSSEPIIKQEELVEPAQTVPGSEPELMASVKVEETSDADMSDGEIAE